MIYLGRRIYFDVNTGKVLVDTRECYGNVRRPAVEEDMNFYFELMGLERNSFDFIDLEYGQYSEQFSSNTPYKVNLVTRDVEFS